MPPPILGAGGSYYRGRRWLWRRLHPCHSAARRAVPPRAAPAFTLDAPAVSTAQMALLLRPGGLLLGSTLGAPIPRPWEASYQAGHSRWLHSGGSLAAALEAAGFGQVQVAPTTWQVSLVAWSCHCCMLGAHEAVAGRMLEG